MKEDFSTDGFVLCKQLIPPHLLHSFDKGLGYLINQSRQAVGLEIKSNTPFHEDMIELDKTDHAQIHKIYNILRKSNLLAEIVYSQPIASMIKRLMELTEEQSFYNTYHICRIDPPRDATFLLKWHQESYSTVPHTPSLQLWAPLIGANNADNGSIDVLKGSHQLKEIPHYLEQLSDNYVSYSIPDASIVDYAKFERVTISAEPGDVLFFSPFLIHKSNHNNSNRVRYSLTSHYVNPHHKNFELLDDNELIRKNRLRCKNAAEFMELISQEKQVYY